MAERRNAKVCFIYAVHYEPEKRHISQVKAQISTGGELEPMKVFTKSEILTKIDSDWIVMTMIKGGVNYVPSADVIAVTINGKRYLKTVANDTEEDNLGELPTF
jgi:hypothetical protein